MGRPLTPSTPSTSLWQATTPEVPCPRPPLPGDADADVVVVGAGFTGLWTAYYLACADPSLRVTVLEAESVGFGASGRNGGWCSALFPASIVRLAEMGGRDAALRMQQAMRDTVDEVGRVVRGEGIDAHLTKGGTIALARSPA
ncbi:MAG: NAD(P)/FAD-dependent oxidoreductase, partial [Nocardioidaceae bacterium]